MREVDMREWLEELQVQRQELDTVIAYVQKQLGIQPSTNGKTVENKRPKQTPKGPKGPMPNPASVKGWRQFVKVGAAAGFTLAELSPVWNAHKAAR